QVSVFDSNAGARKISETCFCIFSSIIVCVFQNQNAITVFEFSQPHIDVAVCVDCNMSRSPRFTSYGYAPETVRQRESPVIGIRNESGDLGSVKIIFMTSSNKYDR